MKLHVIVMTCNNFLKNMLEMSVFCLVTLAETRLQDETAHSCAGERGRTRMWCGGATAGVLKKI